MTGFEGKCRIAGLVMEKELTEAKNKNENDLTCVVVGFIGGQFKFFNEEDLFKTVEQGQEVVVQFETEPDPKAPGLNKMKVKRGTARLVDSKVKAA